MSDTAAPAAPQSAPAEGNSTEASPAEGSKQPSQPPAKKAPPAFRKYKVGDQEVALSDEDIARDYSKWKGADQKFREANEAKQSVEKFMKQLSEDPEAVLNDPRLSIDRRKLATKWLKEQIEQELTPQDPRDQRLKEYEDKLKSFEEKEKQETEAKAAAEKAERVKASMSKIGETLKKAGELSHLSAHPESEAALIREMALYMRAAREQGVEVTPEQIVESIHGQRFQQFYTLAHAHNGEELIEFLGEEIVNRIRKADLARIKAKREGGQQHKSDDWKPAEPKRVNRIDPLTARGLTKNWRD